MALPTFALGSVPTVEHFNYFLRPSFLKDEAEEEFPGQLRRLRDDSLSNDPTQIKTRYTTFEQELLVTIGTGLNVNYKGGRVELPTGIIISISPGTIALPDNTNPSYIFVNESGIVTVATKKPQKLFLLATAITAGGTITSLTDANRSLRGNYIKPQWNAVTLFGGVGSEGDYTVTGAETWSNTYYAFRKLTIASTGSVTIAGGAVINVSESCTIQGAVTVTQQVNGGGGQGFNLTNTTVDSFNGRGISPGSSDSGGTAISFAASVQGSGGASGVAVTATAAGSGITATGGKGGGYVIINCFGDFTMSAGASISADGTNGAACTFISGSFSGGGSGGGSGGLIRIQSYTSITIAGLLSVKGGNGGNAVQFGSGTSGDIGGGGGGGGGYVVLICPTINTTGSTITLSGGTAGSLLGTGNAVRAGGGGGFAGAGGARTATGGIGKLVLRTILPAFAG